MGRRPMGGRGSGGPDRRAAREAAHVLSRLMLARGGRPRPDAGGATQSRANARIAGRCRVWEAENQCHVEWAFGGGQCGAAAGITACPSVATGGRSHLRAATPHSQSRALVATRRVCGREIPTEQAEQWARPRPTRHSVSYGLSAMDEPWPAVVILT